MASTTPYIGSKISLISKAEIRYEGTLYKIDTDESTVTLAREDRQVVKPVGPRSEVFEYIVFKGSDIKDLTVHTEEENDPAQHVEQEEEPDPAILLSAPLASAHPHPPARPPKDQGVTSGPAGMYPQHMQPPQPHNYPMRMAYWGGPHHIHGPLPPGVPPQGMYQPPPPGAPPPGMFLMPGHPGPRYKDPMMGVPSAGGGMWQQRPQQHFASSVTPPTAPPTMPEEDQSEEDTKSPAKLSDLASKAVDRTTSSSEGGTGGGDGGGEGESQTTAGQYSQNEMVTTPSFKGHPASAVAKATTVLSSMQPPPSGYSAGPKPHSSSPSSGKTSLPQEHRVEIVPGHTSTGTPAGPPPVEREQRKHQPGRDAWQSGKPPGNSRVSQYHQHSQPRGGRNNRGRGDYHQGQHGERTNTQYVHHDRDGYRPNYRGGGSNQRGGSYKKPIKFDGEFDFESANARFKKEDLEEEFKVKLNVQESEPVQVEEGEIPATSPTTSSYDKSNSFFDSISREVKGSDSKPYNRGEERNVNTETFGTSGYRRGGRGNYRGNYRGGNRGRGGRGYGRGYHRNTGYRYQDSYGESHQGSRNHDGQQTPRGGHPSQGSSRGGSGRSRGGDYQQVQRVRAEAS